MEQTEKVKIVRTGAYLALLIYGIFGVLDLFMLPVNYKTAWIIRYVFLIPTSITCITLSFVFKDSKYLSLAIYALLIGGLGGILAIISISTPDEPAFFSYYVGLILMILACEFIFRLPLKTTLIFFISTEISYTLVAVFNQNLLDKSEYPNGLSWLIGSLFFMTFSGVISMMGTYKIHKEIKSAVYSKHEAETANNLKSSFLANISHEIRTPLNGIIGFSKLITENYTDDTKKEKYKEIIELNSNQLIEIVDSIIYMSEIESGIGSVENISFSVNEFLENIVKEFSPQLKNKDLIVEVEYNTEQKKEFITTDNQKLRVILHNLINNAIKFTATGKIKISFSVDKHYLNFSVKDSGIGIRTDLINSIFVPFYQIDHGYERKYRGNGLGLSICKSYTEKLGGIIKVASTPGLGSIFTVSIPKKKADNNQYQPSEKQ